jgi:Tol biopolymer transport system component
VRIKLIPVLLLVLICVGASGVFASDGIIERVSVASDGTQGNYSSWAASTNASGRFIAFQSLATNLIPNYTNYQWNVFVRDRQTNTTAIASISDNGTQGNNASGGPSMSADGRYVAFESLAGNLVPNDTNNWIDIFVRDLQTNTTTIVSISDNGTQGNRFSYSPSISADGRYIAFASDASNLVPADTNNHYDVFIRDRQLNITTIVSISDNGTQGDNGSDRPRISSDGRFVAFDSYASNLITPNDTNGQADVYVRDRQTNTTTRVSVASDGTQGNNISEYPSISSDGRYVAFASRASNLVPNDTNGIADIFVRDRQANTTTLVSVASDGTQSNGDSRQDSISSDGRFIAFSSSATNLFPKDIYSNYDIFVRDWQANITAWIGLTTDNFTVNADSFNPNICGYGQCIAFESFASNLVPNDTNNAWDIFIAPNPLYGYSSADTPAPVPASAPHASPALPRQLNQAQISLQYLSVNPRQATANQPLTITGNMVNTGDQAGNYNLALKINGKVEQTRMVSVGPQATQPVKFTVAKPEPGTYTVDVGGQTVSFTILSPSHSSSSTSRGGLLAILIMVVMILATITALLISRRTA